MILVLTPTNGRDDVTKIPVRAIAALQFIQGNENDVQVETFGGKVYRGKPSVDPSPDLEGILIELDKTEPQDDD